MKKKVAASKRNEREPTLKEWHAILTWIVGDNDQVQGAMEFFLRTSPSGSAYLEGAKRLRPTLEIGRGLDLAEVIATHDAATLLGNLIAEKRCGSDPHFYIWKDVWKDSTVGASEQYELAIEIARGMEARASNHAEVARLREVRTAIENELHRKICRLAKRAHLSPTKLSSEEDGLKVPIEVPMPEMRDTDPQTATVAYATMKFGLVPEECARPVEAPGSSETGWIASMNIRRLLPGEKRFLRTKIKAFRGTGPRKALHLAMFVTSERPLPAPQRDDGFAGPGTRLAVFTSYLGRGQHKRLRSERLRNFAG